MTDFAIIDNYIKMELTQEEIAHFEQKVNTDPAFAEEVAFYLSTMHLAKQQLVAEKKKQFRKIYEAGKLENKTTRPVRIKKWQLYIVTAAVVTGLLLGTYFYLQPVPVPQLADAYIDQHFKTAMGVKMDAKEDNLDAAMVLYNDGKLAESLLVFEKLAAADNKADIPKKMAGIVNLRLANYNQALVYFTALENMSLYANPGKFYRALTLIKRNGPEDKKTAKQLLQQVMDMNLEGKETAQQWIHSF